MNVAIVLLVLALTPMAAYAVFPLKTYHVHVVNGMSRPMDLSVHCKSGDDDLGLRNLTTGMEFEWKFRMNFFDTTLFWCNWRSQKLNVHASFKVFWNDDELFYKCNFKNCYWIAKDDGLYLKNVPENYDQYMYHWERTVPRLA